MSEQRLRDPARLAALADALELIAASAERVSLSTDDLRNLSALLRSMTKADPAALAIRFHETYERLAPSFGYETRTDTRQFDPESKNGKLMVAVCAELGAPLPQGADAGVCPHGIHYMNACGACVPPRGTT